MRDFTVALSTSLALRIFCFQREDGIWFLCVSWFPRGSSPAPGGVSPLHPPRLWGAGGGVTHAPPAPLGPPAGLTEFLPRALGGGGGSVETLSSIPKHCHFLQWPTTSSRSLVVGGPRGGGGPDSGDGRPRGQPGPRPGGRGAGRGPSKRSISPGFIRVCGLAGPLARNSGKPRGFWFFWARAWGRAMVRSRKRGWP